MFKVFLVLTAFVGGDWKYLTDEAKPFDSIEACTQAATEFLNGAKDFLDDEYRAVAAECRVGISHNG